MKNLFYHVQETYALYDPLFPTLSLSDLRRLRYLEWETSRWLGIDVMLPGWSTPIWRKHPNVHLIQYC